MEVLIEEEPLTRLADHAGISIAFDADSRVTLAELVPGAQDYPLPVSALPAPRHKDYDAYPGNRPTDWPLRFDVRKWGLLSAFADRRRVGGAVIACGTPDLDLAMGPGRRALLWDLRVAPAARRQGIGTRLLQASAVWARVRGYQALAVETQDINVPACRFYARQGFQLHRIDPDAYPSCPDETRLIWERAL